MSSVVVQVPSSIFAAALRPMSEKMPGKIAGIVPASRLEDRPAVETVSSGIAAVDALTGGIPRGALTEIVGAASSGRTSLMMAALAETTRRQEVCALVDASDAFHPESAEQAGVDLRRLLWVRCSRQQDSRRGLSPVEQALKATDLLLQGGGFGMVVLDLGDIPVQTARRVSLTSWFRFRRVVEHTPTVLMVIEQEPHARTCASLVMRQLAVSSWQLENRPSHARLLESIQVKSEVLHSRVSRRKPMGRAGFESRTAWAG